MGAAPEFSATLALTFALTVLSGNARGLYDRRPHAPMGGPPATRYLRRPITRLSWRPRGPATGQASRPRAEAAPAPDAALLADYQKRLVAQGVELRWPR